MTNLLEAPAAPSEKVRAPRSWRAIAGLVPFALYMLVFLGGAPLGAPMAGWVAEQFGPRMSLLAGGVISVAAAAVIGLLVAHRRGVGAREYLRPAALARMVA